MGTGTVIEFRVGVVGTGTVTLLGHSIELKDFIVNIWIFVNLNRFIE